MRGVLAAVLTLVLAHAVPPAREPAPAPGNDDLVAAVVGQLPVPERAGGVPAPVVAVSRGGPGAGWAFGTAAVPAPAEPDADPQGWLWLARREAGRWRVALEGSPGFGELSQRAPVLARAERAALGSLAGPAGRPDPRRAERAPAPDGVPDYRTGMRLPYAVGQSWRYTGGPHPMSGKPRSSIDLAGGDGKVRAARAGLAYTMCGSGTGWVRVVHDRGFATDYYHLRDAITADGRRVGEGALLGRIGTDVSCGGAATGPHVHFSLRRHGEYVPIHRYGFGKWSIRAGAGGYEGSALHGSRRVDVGGRLYNYGALGLTEAVVDTNGGRMLNRRGGPGTTYPVVGAVRDGATVRIGCSARGSRHTGRDGYTTDLWNRLANGTWVSDAYLWTGTGDPVNGWCG